MVVLVERLGFNWAHHILTICCNHFIFGFVFLEFFFVSFSCFYSVFYKILNVLYDLVLNDKKSITNHVSVWDVLKSKEKCILQIANQIYSMRKNVTKLKLTVTPPLKQKINKKHEKHNQWGHYYPIENIIDKNPRNSLITKKRFTIHWSIIQVTFKI